MPNFQQALLFLSPYVAAHLIWQGHHLWPPEEAEEGLRNVGGGQKDNLPAWPFSGCFSGSNMATFIFVCITMIKTLCVLIILQKTERGLLNIFHIPA